ncbi:DUF4157 domain-containing protein [Candidatus Uabimicrobium sp. HlEnr_7]|uniref:eCIS core domain-containing protein n=1 Tax=Candidatus Uabimicrobium helgolandensis TaxID=3095367 RepID=UPI00355609FB
MIHKEITRKKNTNQKSQINNSAAKTKHLKLLQKKLGNQGVAQLYKRQFANKKSAKKQAKHLQGNVNQTGMPDQIKREMENSFGTDFSDVKIHHSSRLAVDIDALAFTQGNNIHFAPGQYEPTNQKGKKLLAHELTHVVQQKQGRVRPTKKIGSMFINDASSLENEADLMANKIVQRQSNTKTQSHSSYYTNIIQRKLDTKKSVNDSLKIINFYLDIAQDKQKAKVLETAAEKLMLMKSKGNDQEVVAATEPILEMWNKQQNVSKEVIQRNAATGLALTTPILVLGPPGWVSYALLAIGTLSVGIALHQRTATRSKAKAKAEPKVIAKTEKEKLQHRGRLQVQGSDIQERLKTDTADSWPWARLSSPTAKEANIGLTSLLPSLTEKEKKRRVAGFVEASKFITRAKSVGGIPAPFSDSFPTDKSKRDKKYPDARVDIEVKKGHAFI